MDRFETHIRDRHEAALHARGDAESRLIAQFDNGDEILTETIEVARTRALAAWWDQVISAMDREGLDPLEALWRTRKGALRVLVEETTPRRACPFAQAFATASIEAARTFYRATRHLEALSPTGDSATVSDWPLVG